MLPEIEYHEEIQEPPHLIMVDNIECYEFSLQKFTKEEIKHILEHSGTIPRTQLDAKKEIHKNPLIEYIIENPLHDAIEDLKCAQVFVSDNDNTYTPDLPQEETITKIYKENFDEVCMVYDETPLCCPLSDEVLENFAPSNIFETRPFVDDYCEHEDGHNQEHDAFDGDSPIFDKDIDGNYWLFMENPIYDISREGSVDSKSVEGFLENPIYHMPTEESIHSETLGRIGMAEKHAEFSHDQLEPYMCISSEDIEKQYHEESDMMQLTRD